jgi:hypothetical protein
MAQSQSQSKKAGGDEEQIEPQPLAPAPATAAGKAIRGKVSTRFNGTSGPALDSSEAAGYPPPPPNIALSVPMPPLPFGRSSIAILGEVVKTQPYLSEDKRQLYTEFTVRVNEVFWTSSGFAVNGGDTVLIVREGGSLRLPDGRVVTRVLRGRGNALQGARKYVLFLGDTPGIARYYVETAYELHSGRVIPTEVHCSLQEANDLSAKGEQGFLATVRAAIR